MGRACAWLLILAVTGGCASAPIRFTSLQGASQEQFRKDRQECALEAQQTVTGALVNEYGTSTGTQDALSCAAFNSCLANRGYLRDDQRGVLVVPDDDPMPCHH
jgi:hypothetical protein